MISGCVTVTGPPASICFLKRGMTEPLDPRTLPVSGTQRQKSLPTVFFQIPWIGFTYLYNSSYYRVHLVALYQIVLLNDVL